MPGLKDPFFIDIMEYVKKQKLEGADVEEVLKVAVVLRNLDEGNPPNFGSHSISSIEFFLGKEISPIGRKMLQEKFKITMKPPCKPFESGMR